MALKQWVSGAALVAAVVSSVATSRPNNSWNVVEHEKAVALLDRDTDVASFFVEIEANAIAMSMPDPVLEEPPETDEIAPLFYGSLEVRVDARTTGVFGIDAEDTDVIVRILSLDDEVLAEETAFLEMQEPQGFRIQFDGLFAGCPLDQTCVDAYRVEVESTRPSRVVADLEIWARLNGPYGETAPKDAAIAIAIEEE